MIGVRSRNRCGTHTRRMPGPPRIPVLVSWFAGMAPPPHLTSVPPTKMGDPLSQVPGSRVTQGSSERPGVSRADVMKAAGLGLARSMRNEHAQPWAKTPSRAKRSAFSETASAHPEPPRQRCSRLLRNRAHRWHRRDHGSGRDHRVCAPTRAPRGPRRHARRCRRHRSDHHHTGRTGRCHTLYQGGSHRLAKFGIPTELQHESGTPSIFPPIGASRLNRR